MVCALDAEEKAYYMSLIKLSRLKLFRDSGPVFTGSLLATCATTVIRSWCGSNNDAYLALVIVLLLVVGALILPMAAAFVGVNALGEYWTECCMETATFSYLKFCIAVVFIGFVSAASHGDADDDHHSDDHGTDDHGTDDYSVDDHSSTDDHSIAASLIWGRALSSNDDDGGEPYDGAYVLYLFLLVLLTVTLVGGLFWLHPILTSCFESPLDQQKTHGRHTAHVLLEQRTGIFALGPAVCFISILFSYLFPHEGAAIGAHDDATLDHHEYEGTISVTVALVVNLAFLKLSDFCSERGLFKYNPRSEDGANLAGLHAPIAQVILEEITGEVAHSSEHADEEFTPWAPMLTKSKTGDEVYKTFYGWCFMTLLYLTSASYVMFFYTVIVHSETQVVNAFLLSVTLTYFAPVWVTKDMFSLLMKDRNIQKKSSKYNRDEGEGGLASLGSRRSVIEGFNVFKRLRKSVSRFVMKQYAYAIMVGWSWEIFGTAIFSAFKDVLGIDKENVVVGVISVVFTGACVFACHQAVRYSETFMESATSAVVENEKKYQEALHKLCGEDDGDDNGDGVDDGEDHAKPVESVI